MIALTKELRAAMRSSYQRLATLPLIGALGGGTPPVESCVGLLDALAIIHAPLEQAAAHAPVLATVWDETLRRLPLLERDLAALPGPAADQRPALRPAVLRALAVASQVRHRAIVEPASLVGTLWALSGPDLAMLLPRALIEQALHLREPDRLAYLATRDRWLGPDWTAFLDRSEALLAAGLIERRRAVEAATEIVDGLAWVVERLYPLVSAQSATAADLNPQAGSHTIPADLREVEASVVAGERTWRAWPYMAARYGARGQRYTRSDSAWIATLAGYDQPSVDHQIAWLGGLLAARGMPRMILEDHLRVLADELVQAVPERAADYARLMVAADRLAAERWAHLGDGVLAELAASFERQIGPAAAGRLPGVGRLLGAAVADEQAGLPKAVASIEGWLVDPSRSPSIPADAVRSVIEQARQQAR